MPSRQPHGARAFLLGAVLGAAALSAAPAGAVPSAEASSELEASAVLRGADGATWTLALAAVRSGVVEAVSEQRLAVELSRCQARRCATAGRWSKPLLAGELEVAADASSGTVTTTLFGQPLVLRLASTTGATDPGGRYFVLDPWVEVGTAKSATGTLALGGAGCRAADALIAQDVLIDPAGPPPAAQRPAPPERAPAGLLAARGGARLSCG